jgi:L-aminopeptidase/D-esterase-like protein
VSEGNVGAGAGATVGKLLGMDRAMKGGLGTASLQGADGLVVAALAAVNALGDVIDPATGRRVAGARSADGHTLEGSLDALVAGRTVLPSAAGNTTLAVVGTNAALTKAEATRVAQMAHDGFARTIQPAHTPWDGDTIFALSRGSLVPPAGVMAVGAMAAEAVARAILRAIEMAQGLPGLPSAADLRAP